MRIGQNGQRRPHVAGAAGQAVGQTARPTDRQTVGAHRQQGFKTHFRRRAKFALLLCKTRRIRQRQSRAGSNRWELLQEQQQKQEQFKLEQQQQQQDHMWLGRLGLVIFSWHNKEFTIIACKSPVK